MTTIAELSIGMALICGLIIAIDIVRRPQKMTIMNIVWPVTALYSGPLGLLAYYSIGKKSAAINRKSDFKQKKPMWQSVLTGTLHCGSGCTLGDLVSAWLLLQTPVIIFGSKLAGEWVIEYVAAFLIGIIFQYYAIKPMRNLPAGAAILAAFKADALSLTCWQIGMYGWMAVSNFLIFHSQLHANELVFWLMMQVGMLCGLVTAYPVNWWLIRKGIKEAM